MGELTSEEPLAGQVAAVMEQVEAPVIDDAERLPLPDQDMIEWRDELERDVRRAARQALVGDPTYRAGIEAVLPDWDGGPTTAVSSRDGMADTVIAIEDAIITGVEQSVVAACDDS